MNYIDNKFFNALLGIFTFFVTYIIQNILGNVTALNMDNVFVDLGIFVLIYFIIHLTAQLLVYKIGKI